jgi:hypothetical protein
MGEAVNDVVKRSTFVTAVAWVFIALSGFATLISILQNVMITLMLPVEEMREATKAENAQAMPGIFRFMANNVRLFFFIPLVVFATTLASAIGLLMRKNWARIAFISILALGIALELASIAMPFFMSSWMAEMPIQQQSDFDKNFKLMWNIMMGVITVMNLLIAGLFAWIIKRLISPSIKREFIES